MPKALTEVVTELYGVLEPLEPSDREKALRAALVLLGQSILPPQGGGGRPAADGPVDSSPAELGPAAARWLTQNQVGRDSLDNLFHIDSGEVVPIFSAVPGASRREQTANCYLLAGIIKLLATDEAVIDDREAVELCQQVGAYDRNNHTSNRSSLGSRVTGNRATGFKLTVPGLREAARLVKSMGSNVSDG